MQNFGINNNMTGCIFSRTVGFVTDIGKSLFSWRRLEAILKKVVVDVV